MLIFCLASNLFWGSWAVVQSSLTTLDFDYIGYAKLRFDGYFYQKDLFRESVEKLKQEFGV
ncbi:hypothetical protein EON65_22610 [archaeon]|nr:MAG: hypothetical protein EON65_22610 [archaeon]